jgi:hypothetical protein
MKKVSLILTSLVLFAGISFAQQNLNPDPAKNPHPKSNQAAKSDKKVPAKKSDTKSDKKGTATPSAK